MKTTQRITQRVILIALSFIICTLSFSPARAQIGTWRNYLAYHDVQQIQAAGNELFVRASNGLYQYNKQDQSIYTYDKTKGLSDTYITKIRWCQQAKRLVVVYDNSNIDLVETNGDVTNISDIYSKSITGGKTIYNIYCNGIYAYLACEFGIIKVNVKNAEISETYTLGFPVNAVVIEGSNIYAQSTTRGVWTANTQKNLIDPSSWSQTDSYPFFDEDWTDYNDNIELVKTLNPDGPQFNEFYESKFVNGKLYTTGGAFRTGQIGKDNPGIVQIWDGTNWTVYPTNINETTGFNYRDINCIDVDPTDNSHVAVAGRCGLYEFQNGVLKAYHYKGNSPLRPVGFEGDYYPDDYTLVNGIKYDSNGNLWVLNGQTAGINLMVLNKDGEWVKHTQSGLLNNYNVSKPGMRCAMFDSRGLLWFVNTYFNNPSFHYYDPSTNQLFSHDSFTNQDGTSYQFCYPYDITEDKSGNIWIATNSGPFIIKSEEIGQSSVTLYQEKVPRNDGTNLADYLLTGLQCSSVAVDGAGRKWIGTSGTGVFLISEDNMTQIQHFTAENSDLLSDDIRYISINSTSGEVFFLTDKGLCSYLSDATEAATEMTKDNVWAYPNPVTPEYTGLITIVGLSMNADVKILAPNGALIAEGKSNGGTFTWDGNDRDGNRVASGIYMVATATSSGEKGTVCKIAIIR